MKNFSLLFVVFLAACASGPKPKYVEEKNQAKFATTKDVTQKPDAVKLAARAVLDDLTRASTPAAEGSIETDEDTLRSGKIYSAVSRDKYVDVPYNGTVQHKTLAVRRIYQFTVNPSLAGSQVVMQIKEEIQQLNMKTGEPTGWKKVDPEKAQFDLLYRNLMTQLNRL